MLIKKKKNCYPRILIPVSDKDTRLCVCVCVFSMSPMRHADIRNTVTIQKSKAEDQIIFSH